MKLESLSRQPNRCAVCELPCARIGYGVPNCEGCRHFFRRTVAFQKVLFCTEVNCCDVSKKNGCRSCRLDKCLRAGMRWEPIKNKCNDNSVRFFEDLAMRTASGQNQAIQTFSLPDGSDANLLQHLLRIARAHERVWCAGHETPDEYLDGISPKLGVNLASPENILSRANSYSINVPHLYENQKAQLMHELDRVNLIHPRYIKITVVDHLLAMGFAKALPVFKKLALEDQVLLVRHLNMPAVCFFYSYYAAKLGSPIWCYADGFAPTTYNKLDRFKSDERLVALGQRASVQSVVPFHRTPIGSPEEFGLLMAILLTHSAIPELSTIARELLYAESVRYSRMLMRLLQSRLGAAQGAARYAESLHLVESAFHSARHRDLVVTYLEAFHYRSVILDHLPKYCTLLFLGN